MKLGENITREWHSEPNSQALLAVLHRLRDGDISAKNELRLEAESGSPLAMMYLGEFLLKGLYGLAQDRELGRSWLQRAVAAGSVEAAYRAAFIAKQEGRLAEAIGLYSKLANQGYAPAYFRLGGIYLNDIEEAGSEERAIQYYDAAAQLGHIPSHALLLWLKTRGKGPFVFMRSIPTRLRLIRALLRTNRDNPNSDFLRK